jgi:hypothetical protein
MLKDGKVGMGVDINKTWGGHEPIRFNKRFSSSYRRCNLCDHSLLNGDICPKGLLIRAIDHQRTPNEQ